MRTRILAVFAAFLVSPLCAEPQTCVEGSNGTTTCVPAGYQPYGARVYVPPALQWAWPPRRDNARIYAVPLICALLYAFYWSRFKLTINEKIFKKRNLHTEKAKLRQQIVACPNLRMGGHHGIQRRRRVPRI